MPKKNGEPTRRELRKFYGEWNRGLRTKTDIERRELNVSTGRGKTITRLWDAELGANTLNVVPQAKLNR